MPLEDAARRGRRDQQRRKLASIAFVAVAAGILLGAAAFFIVFAGDRFGFPRLAGEPRLDGSNFAALQESIVVVERPLREDEKRLFRESIDYLQPNLFDYATTGVGELLSDLDGKTAAEVIEAAAAKIREDGSAWAEREAESRNARTVSLQKRLRAERDEVDRLEAEAAREPREGAGFDSGLFLAKRRLERTRLEVQAIESEIAELNEQPDADPADRYRHALPLLTRHAFGR